MTKFHQAVLFIAHLAQALLVVQFPLVEQLSQAGLPARCLSAAMAVVGAVGILATAWLTAAASTSTPTPLQAPAAGPAGASVPDAPSATAAPGWYYPPAAPGA